MTDIASPEVAVESGVATETPDQEGIAAEASPETELAVLNMLNQDPNLMPEIEMVIRDYLAKGVTPTTLDVILQGLGFYMGPDESASLLMILIQFDDEQQITRVKSRAAPSIWNWLRRVLALYGKNLQEAHLAWGENPASWRQLDRRAYYDAMSRQWSLQFEITRYNGEHIVITETPRSALRLARSILDTLNSIPAEVAPDLIPADSLRHFADIAGPFFELYAAKLPELRLATHQDEGGGVTCPQCDQENRAGAKFCAKCGQTLTSIE